MIKEAKVNYPVHELISKRWSARSFSKEPVTKETVLTLIEAASWAPSSVNEQPWEYYYSFKGTAGFDKMLACLSTGNQIWVKDAPVLLLCLSHKNFAKSGEPNRHYMHDAGLANANLLTQALSMNIYCHILGGFDTEKTIESFHVPEHIEAVCFITLGYLGNPEKLDEPFKTREVTPRTRKIIEEISKEI